MNSPLPLRDRSSKSSFASRATLIGFGVFAVACFASLSGQAAESLWLDAARSSITNTELHSHVSVLADDILEGREAGSRGGQAAAKYIIERLENAGLEPAGENGQFTQRFLGNFQNLLAVLPGSDPQLQHEYIVVGAHYDHVGYGNRRNSYGPWGYIHNGADDNASGVAAVLEAIDALAQTGYRPRRSILFAFWDGEEKGLLGSKHWRRQPTLSFDGVKLAINIDMVGRLTDGRIEVGGTRSGYGSRKMMSSPRLSEEVWLDFSWEYKNNSDHWTFFEAGVPSLYVHTGLHDDYHRPSDDVEKLNIDGIRLVSAYLMEQLSSLADAEQLPSYRSAASREHPFAQKRAEQPLPKLASRIDFRWKYIESDPAAVVVEGIGWNSRAQQVGLSPGDRIVAVNGQPIVSEATLPAIALQSKSEINLQVVRGSNEPTTLSLPLVGTPTKLGLSWRSDPAEPEAVYITRVVPYSPADLAGIKLYDRLQALNGEAISDPDELLSRVQNLLQSGVGSLDYEIESRGAIRTVTVQLGTPAPSPTDATL